VDCVAADRSETHIVSSANNTRLFAGEQLDATTGLYYDRARWYDSSTGGFISRDPAEADANLYRYAGNDPTGMVDPSGMYYTGGTGGDGPSEDGAGPTPARPKEGGPCPPKQPLAHDGSVPDGSKTAGGGRGRGWHGTSPTGRGGMLGRGGLARAYYGKQPPAWMLETPKPKPAADEPVFSIWRPWTWGLLDIGELAKERADAVDRISRADFSEVDKAVGLPPKVTQGIALTASDTITIELTILFSIYGPEADLAELASGEWCAGNEAAAAAESGALGAGTALRPVGQAMESVSDVLANPKLLAGRTPAEVEAIMGKTPGWQVESLGKGAHQGQGWLLREYGANGQPTGRLIQWHPGNSTYHGPSPYWKVSSGPGGTVRVGPQFP